MEALPGGQKVEFPVRLQVNESSTYFSVGTGTLSSSRSELRPCSPARCLASVDAGMRTED